MSSSVVEWICRRACDVANKHAGRRVAIDKRCSPRTITEPSPPSIAKSSTSSFHAHRQRRQSQPSFAHRQNGRPQPRSLQSNLFPSSLRTSTLLTQQPSQFGMYILFPISIMYYFGTNLDNRFSVPDFWPKPGQTHKIPYDRDEIAKELERLKARNLENKRRREEEERRMRELGVGGGREE